MVPLAALLRDDEVYALVMPQIRRSLALAAPDGFIGPEELQGAGATQSVAARGVFPGTDRAVERNPAMRHT